MLCPKARCFLAPSLLIVFANHNGSSWCASTGKLESTISNARTKNTVMSSTGTPDAVKVARPVWMRGKIERSYLCIRKPTKKPSGSNLDGFSWSFDQICHATA